MSSFKNDFSGSKLLFYSKNTSSRLLADFIQDHKEIDTQSLTDFLLFGTVLPPRSPLQGVSQLFPGEQQDNGESHFAYLDLGYEISKKKLSEFVDAFDMQLEAYFKRNQSTQTVLLSGGIDSAILLSYLPRGASCITWGGKGEQTDDVRYSRVTAERFGVAKHDFAFANYEQDFALYEKAVRALKIPLLFNSSVPFLRMAEVGRDNAVDSWLVGQNADTLFMSYPAPVLTKWLSQLNAFVPLNPISFLQFRRSYLFSTPSAVRLLAYFKSLGVYPGQWFSVPDSYFKNKEDLYNKIPARNLEQRIIAFEEILTESRRNQICQNEIPALSGITSLCPYYEQEIVQLALSVPPSLRRLGKYGKVILKELARKRGVPEEVIFKKKSGLSYGLNNVLDDSKYLLLWDRMEEDPDLNRLIDVKRLRAHEEKNYLTFIMLMSLHYWFEFVARPEGLRMPE